MFIPPSVTMIAKQDAWIALLIGILINVLIVGMYLLLARLCSNRNLFEIVQFLFGKFIGAFIIIGFIIYAYITGAINVLYEVGYFSSTQIFVKTPVIMLNAMFALIVIMAVRLGLRTFARASEILVPIVIVLLLISAVAVIPDIDVDKIRPVFQTNLQRLFLATFYFNSFSCFPLILLLSIYPKDVEGKKAAKGFLVGSILGGVVLLVLTVVDIVVLGADNTSHYTFPGYVLAQRINIGGFLTRIEVIISVLWFISFFFKMVIYFYATLQGLTQLTSIQSSKIFTIPLGIIAVLLSVNLHPNTMSFNEWSKSTWPAIGVFFGLLLPFIMILIAFIRKKQQSALK